MKLRARVSHRPLTVTRAKSGKGVKSADISQSPDYTVTNTIDGGGLVLTSVEVVVIFWGSYWSSSSPAPTVSSDTYYRAFTGVVTGPYMTGLRQYRGVGPGSMLGRFVYTGSEPADGYADSDVVTMLNSFLAANPGVAPAADHTRFYAVITAPGVNNGMSGDLGQHQSFAYNGITSFYCWVDTDGTLTDSSSTGAVNVFSHELVETCTDPLGSGILIDGTQSDGTAVTGDEIGDTCNNEFSIVQMNGVNCNVQCYWSAADNACIIPLGRLSFLINKSYFGLDEVKEAIKTTHGVFSNAFWLALDDFSIDTFNSFTVAVPIPSGAFADLAGVQITPSPATPGGPTPAQPIPVYEDPTDTTVIQRIRFSYDVTFSKPLVTPFPATGGTEYPLTATFSTNGTTVPGAGSQDTVNFELVAGADPYFSNIDITDGAAVSWLSQDLRVFSLTKGHAAVAGGPTFGTNQTPYEYVRDLLGHLNGSSTYTVPVPPGPGDPLNHLPAQGGYETGLSSVTPLDSGGHQNYNFAIARVRLTSDVQGAPSDAKDVRVFFRLWVAPSYDTDFDPYTTYPSSPAYPAAPTTPLPSSSTLASDPTGQAIQTTPFYATGASGADDYVSGVANNNIRKLEVPVVPGQDGVWAYYGCFLDVYDASNNCSYPGTHHCLVAQIAFDGAPLLYQSGTATNPGNTDKLAQRNIQITLSGNPGPASTHRVPQAFDTRPSPPFLDANGQVLNQPDELMIDWGRTPVGSKVQIFWPEVEAADVLALAARLYGTQLLSVLDAHTIGLESVKGVSYIPIPSASTRTFAGLFTVDLPIGVRKGQEFDVVVRRIATNRHAVPGRVGAGAVPQAQIVVRGSFWRYITGAFQIKIPVTTEDHLLAPAEDTLAIFKARLAAMSPSYRWYPVLALYIEYLSAKVDGAGGDAAAVPPSLLGYLPGRHGQRSERSFECTGKINGLIFDRFGDFEGFLLDTEEGEHRFNSREEDMRDLAEGAWRERLRISVRAEHDEPHEALKVVLRDPPARFRE